MNTRTPQSEPVPTPAAASPVRLQRKCACGGLERNCEECRKKGTLQRKSAGRDEPEPAPPIVHEVLRSPGHPLDPATRAFMEPRFGHDFSQVQVHTDTRAAESARAVNALAYTVGWDIVFGAGHYKPGTVAGQQLLAHELTHTIQQSKTVVTKSHDQPERATGTITPPVQGVVQRQGGDVCCCCPSGFLIDNIKEYDDGRGMGHDFHSKIDLKYSEGERRESCGLEWWEKTNFPYIKGMAPNTWTELTTDPSTSLSFPWWQERREPCGAEESVEDIDSPGQSTVDPNTGRPRTRRRVLEFRILVRGGPGCACDGKGEVPLIRMTARQVLAVVKGKPDWKNSFFESPNELDPPS